MRVIYQDDIGIISVIVDSKNIMFFMGELWFDSNGEEYRLPINRIIGIEKF